MNKLLCALCLLTQLAGCKAKDPIAPAPLPANPLDQLPPATQTGQYTFGCLVNGQAWVPAGSPLAGPLVSSSYSGAGFGLSANRIRVVNGANSFQRVGFFIENLRAVGIYPLDQPTERVGSYENFDNSCKFYTSSAHVGTVQITRLDPVARVVSGRFSFTLDTPGCGQVAVTDGRFDVGF